VHNLVIANMLHEAHDGRDAPWSYHRLLNWDVETLGWYGGSVAHDVHHRFHSRHFTQFFTFIDRLCGLPSDGEAQRMDAGGRKVLCTSTGEVLAPHSGKKLTSG